MLKKRFISVALSALFLFTALTPAALAAGEASTRPEPMVSIQYAYINRDGVVVSSDNVHLFSN
ncbi:MAG: hypothetical protein M1552_08675 [Firmicutes bacterium]|nr:hypothetical protein [Bacillota bacterium]MCL5994211.1 hypothetical protein [Bacillota bacterium]